MPINPAKPATVAAIHIAASFPPLTLLQYWKAVSFSQFPPFSLCPLNGIFKINSLRRIIKKYSSSSSLLQIGGSFWPQARICLFIFFLRSAISEIHFIRLPSGHTAFCFYCLPWKKKKTWPRNCYNKDPRFIQCSDWNEWRHTFVSSRCHFLTLDQAGKEGKEGKEELSLCWHIYPARSVARFFCIQKLIRTDHAGHNVTQKPPVPAPPASTEQWKLLFFWISNLKNGSADSLLGKFSAWLEGWLPVSASKEIIPLEYRAFA